MAGIYIHIPFCRQACTYCDFHFSTSLNIKKEVVAAIKTELELRKNYLNEPVETIYFGGGTPSLLSAAEIDAIIEAIFKNYAVDLKECTLEANPDDLAKSYLTELAKTKVNRLSMGIQSFNDGVLKWMNRTHNSQTAIAAVKDAYRSGIQNISIDLIYATPNSTVKDIEKNLSIALSLPVNHLSAYCLTAEEKTVYGKMVSTGKISEAEQENAQQQFLFLVHRATENGFEQYEISNFCKNENYAMHNTSYWKNRNYLGIGPSAHSYNGTSRQWNLKNNFSYVKAIKENTSFFEIEELTSINKINEYLMTTLRTKWGADLNYLKENITTTQWRKLTYAVANAVQNGLIDDKNGLLSIPLANKFIADKIISDLFVEEP